MNIDLSRFDSIFDTIQENAIMQTNFLSSIANAAEETMELNLLGFASLEKSLNSLEQSMNGTNQIISKMFSLNEREENIEGADPVSNETLTSIKTILERNDSTNETLTSIKSILEKNDATNETTNEELNSISKILERSNITNKTLESIRTVLSESSSSDEMLESIKTILERNVSLSEESNSSQTLESIKTILERNVSLSEESNSSQTLESIKTILERNSSRNDSLNTRESLDSIESIVEKNEITNETLDSIRTVLSQSDTANETLESIKSVIERSDVTNNTLDSIRTMLSENNLPNDTIDSIIAKITDDTLSNNSLLEQIRKILEETLDFQKQSTDDSPLNDILNSIESQRKADAESRSDAARKAEKDKVKRDGDVKAEADLSGISKFFSDLTENLFAQVKDVSGFDLFKAGLLAPLLFEFTKAFIGQLTDGLFEELELLDVPKILAGLAFWKTLGPILTNTLGKSLRGIYNVIIGTSKTIADIAKITTDFIKGSGGRVLTGIRGTFGTLFSNLGKIFSPIVNFATAVTKFIGGAMGNTFAFLGRITGITGVLRTIGKIFKPIGVIISAFEGLQAFAESEGTFLEKLGAGIGQFFGSFFGSVLDLIKNAGAWLLGKLGFENAESLLSEFSFEGLIRDTIEGFFGLISGAVEWVKLLFTDPSAALTSLWETALGGFKSLLDIIFFPVDQAIQWIMELFGWSSEEGQEFSLTNTIWSAVSSAVDWVKSLFTDPIAALSELWTTALGGFKSLLDIIFYPIDQAIQWVMGLFGWAPEEGQEFSLTDTIWSAVSSVFEWVKGLFANPVDTLTTMWNEIVGEDGLFGIIKEWGTSFINWLTGFLPDIDVLRENLLSIMPDWMRKLVGAPERTAEEIVQGEIAERQTAIDEARDRLTRSEAGENVYYGREETNREEDLRLIAENEAALTELTREDRTPDQILAQRELADAWLERQALIDSSAMSGITPDTSYYDNLITELEERLRTYRTGSPGFVDFGEGSLAVLHGREAVVPFETPAGQLLNSVFNENWSPKQSQEIEMLNTPPNISSMLMSKRNYVAAAGETLAMDRQRAQMAITNVMPQMINARPVTNNNSSTTIINNVSPARSLDDPAMLR